LPTLFFLRVVVAEATATTDNTIRLAVAVLAESCRCLSG
jgi:hypothetical protein